MSDDQFARVGELEIAYRIYGPDNGDNLLLVGGLDTTLTTWDPDLIAMLTNRGFRVIVGDNRDSGLSTQITAEHMGKLGFIGRSVKGQLGKLGPSDVPYTLVEMGGDWVGLLEVLSIDEVHVCGHSLGGMIAQEIAIAAPGRVKSLTCISSTTGERDVGKPKPKAALLVAKATGDDADSAIEGLARKYAFTSGPDGDEGYGRARAEASLRRANTPDGRLRRLLAGPATRDRVELLKKLPMPVVVVHGALDPSIQVDGGRRLAEVVNQAEYFEVARMGHELIPPFFDDVVNAIDRARELSMVS